MPWKSYEGFLSKIKTILQNSLKDFSWVLIATDETSTIRIYKCNDYKVRQIFQTKSEEFVPLLNERLKEIDLFSITDDAIPTPLLYKIGMKYYKIDSHTIELL